MHQTKLTRQLPISLALSCVSEVPWRRRILSLQFRDPPSPGFLLATFEARVSALPLRMRTEPQAHRANSEKINFPRSPEAIRVVSCKFESYDLSYFCLLIRSSNYKLTE